MACSQMAAVAVVFLLAAALFFSAGCLLIAVSRASSRNPVPFPAWPAYNATPAMPGEKLDDLCGPVSCDAAVESELREQFDAMGVSDNDACSAIVKDTLCAMRCGPHVSMDHFDDTAAAASNMARSLPDLLCGSSSSSSARRLRTAHGLLCVEKVSSRSFLNMVPHPDGSARVFLSSQEGRIWPASVPVPGSGGTLHIPYGARPFLDIRHKDAALGLRGFVFHSEFETNGRFFVAYTCDSASPACGGAGECWVPAPDNRWKQCRYQLVVAEYRARVEGGGGCSSKDKPSEVRRIFSVGLSEPQTPYSYQHHGGQLLFRHSDGNGYLYLITGIEFVSSKNIRPGQILRFDVDSSAPKVHVYAMGVAHPSGCSFDSERQSLLYCAGVGQRRYEQVHLVSDGPGSQSNASSAVSVIVNHGLPAPGKMPSIVAGRLYRGSADLSLVGSYLHMYGHDVWLSMETTTGRYTSARIPNVRCSTTTPLACRGIDGLVVSFGEDNNKDVYVLTTGGVYRIVHPDLCGAPPPQAMLIWYLCIFAALLYAIYKACGLFLPDTGGCSVTACTMFCSCCYSTNHYYGAAQLHEV